MSKKTVDRHTLCVSCHSSECDIDHCCEECADWPEEDVLLYVKHWRTLKSRRSKSKAPPPPPPPAAPSVPSSQPFISDVESRLELLTSQVSALTELFTARLAAPQAFCVSPSASQAPSQARLESDARCPHPVGTAGFHQESQALGGSVREPDATGSLHDRQAKLGGDLRASAGHGWGSPSMQAPRHSPLAPGGFFFNPPPRMLRVIVLHHRRLVPLPVGLLGRLRSFRLLLPVLLVIWSRRPVIAVAALPLLLWIPLPLSWQCLYTTFVRRHSRFSIPLLLRAAVSRRGSTPRQPRPLLALVIGCTFVSLRWSPRSRIVRLRSTAAVSLCLRCYRVRSVAMRLRISRTLRLRIRLTLRFPVWRALRPWCLSTGAP